MAVNSDSEFAKVDSELKAVGIEMSSSKEALVTKTRLLRSSLKTLHLEEVRRIAVERTADKQAVSLKKMQAKAVQLATALSSMNATIANTAVELRLSRSQLQTVVHDKASEAAHAEASLRSQLKDSHAESEDLRQKVGRVVQMVQADLSDKDRQATELLAAEHARTEKVKRELEGQQKELKELRTRSSELAEENYKLQARASHPDDVYTSSSHKENAA